MHMYRLCHPQATQEGTNQKDTKLIFAIQDHCKLRRQNMKGMTKQNDVGQMPALILTQPYHYLFFLLKTTPAITNFQITYYTEM